MVHRFSYLGAREGFEAAAAALGEAADLVHVDATPRALRKALETSDGLIDASMAVPITETMIRGASRLKAISCATTGADHIERGEITARNIRVMTLRDDPGILHNLTPTAELTWTLLLACARRLVPAVAHVRDGAWVRENYPGIMLRGRTIGIIGCGRIGQWVARYATAFEMEVVGHDPHLEDWPQGIRRVPLATLVEQSDFVTVHVHLTEETRRLMSRELFQTIKPGAVFINTSRGGVVDEDALLQALVSGRLAAAGLDVLDGEPDIAGHPLIAYARDHENLLITPHCGGFSPDAVRSVCGHAARKLLEALS